MELGPNKEGQTDGTAELVRCPIRKTEAPVDAGFRVKKTQRSEPKTLWSQTLLTSKTVLSGTSVAIYARLSRLQRTELPAVPIRTIPKNLTLDITDLPKQPR